MIYSRHHGFLCLKGVKVASTSVEVFLSGLCKPGDIITPITPVDERFRASCGFPGPMNYGCSAEDHSAYMEIIRLGTPDELARARHPKSLFYNHMPLSEVEALVGHLDDSLVVFAIERCPYRKVISQANMDLTFDSYKQGGGTMATDFAAIRNQVDAMIADESIFRVRNLPRYTNADGRIRAEIVRFEEMESGVQAVLAKCGVECRVLLPHLKKGISAKGYDVGDIMSRQQIDWINEQFADEFDAFGYSRIT